MTLAMSWDEWARHDAVALAGRVRAGEVTAAELAAQAAAGIAALNPTLGAVVEVFEDVVADPLRDGMDADGAFAGVPYLMKDLGPTLAGRLQEMGSHLMRGTRAAADSHLTGRIRKAGLNVIGRSTTPEFGCCSSAENPAMYVTRNPWDVAYTTNGSSAGTAAAVSAGVLPISHATDGGGSIRIPAGATGNIGLKPSRGVFSIAPYASDLTGLVSIQGCHSRTVRDTALFVDQCRGGAPGEFMPYWTTPEPYSELIRRDPAYQNGNYAEQPVSLRMANVFYSLGTSGGTQFLQAAAPSRAAADTLVDSRLAAAPPLDANDFIYQWDASRDYDPSAQLDRIKARVLAINAADDERNPPETGLMDAAMAKIPGAQMLLIPASAKTLGHGTTGTANFYAEELRRFVEGLE